jgi:hypothetical protein
LKIGLEENLESVRVQLSQLAQALDDLPNFTADLPEEEREIVAKQRTLITNNLNACERALGDLQNFYGLSDEERMTLLRLIAQKQSELRIPSESAAAAAQQPESVRPGPTAAKEPVDANPPSENETTQSAPR